MVEQIDNNNDVMIQLPWTVPQQPLYTTLIEVDPKTKKIPIDLNVSSYDWIVASSIFVSAVISFIGFIATIYIVRSSTRAQMKSNQHLILSQKKLKEMELTDLHHREILKEITLFEQCRFSIEVYFKSRSDDRLETEDERDKVRNDLKIFITQSFKLKSFMKAYKDIDLDDQFRNLNNKINELIESLLKYQEKGVDSEIQTIIEAGDGISQQIYDAIKKAA